MAHIPSENALYSSNSHAIYDISSKAKWYRLWCRQYTTLFKSHTKVNVYHLSSFGINQNILNVTVTEAKYITNCKQTVIRCLNLLSGHGIILPKFPDYEFA